MSLIDLTKIIIKEELRLEGKAVDKASFDEDINGAIAYVGKVRVIVYDPKNDFASAREASSILRGTRLSSGEHVYASGNTRKIRWYAIADNS